jgi:hypothetical protein
VGYSDRSRNCPDSWATNAEVRAPDVRSQVRTPNRPRRSGLAAIITAKIDASGIRMIAA